MKKKYFWAFSLTNKTNVKHTFGQGLKQANEMLSILVTLEKQIYTVDSVCRKWLLHGWIWLYEKKPLRIINIEWIMKHLTKNAVCMGKFTFSYKMKTSNYYLTKNLNTLQAK